MTLEQEIKQHIRDVQNFPKPGIVFKDLTPILKNIPLCEKMVAALSESVGDLQPDALVALDSRGFWFGLPLAARLGIPMIPIRKAGKLPYETISQKYDLEYGEAAVEMHIDALKPGWKVVIHDDLLATGGTAEAASQLVRQQKAFISGYAFLTELSSLKGKERLKEYSDNIISLTVF